MLVLSRAPGDPLGPIVTAGALGGLVAGTAEALAVHADETGDTAAAQWLGWVSEWAGAPVFLIPAVALLLFPDGRPLSPRWRWWVGVGIAGAVLVELLAFAGGALSSAAFDVGASLFVASVAGLAIAMGVAILHHRLYGLDVYVDRALVATAVTVVLGVLYAVVLLAVGALFGGSDVGLAIPATVAVAVALAPVRGGVQRLAGRVGGSARAARRAL